MFGLGVPELFIILVIGLVVFGAGELPEVGRAFGKSIREFKEASTEDPKMIDVTKKDKEAKNG